MPNAKLSKWIPNVQKATLYWLSSPWKGSNGQIYLSADFKTLTGAFYRINLPWGDLPILTMGWDYHNGVPCGKSDGLIKGKFSINHNVTQTDFDSAYDAIPLGLYPLKPCPKDNAEQTKIPLKGALAEYCLKLEQDGFTYIIPCIEVMRAVYANKAFLANCMINTHGLSTFTIEESVEGRQLKVAFSEDYPTSFLDRDSVTEFVWLKHTNAYNEVQSIYTQWVTEKRIKVNLPKQSNIEYHYFGFQKGSHILIVNLELHNLIVPFSTIHISHPSLKEKDGEKPSNKVVYHYKQSSEELLLNPDMATNKQSPLLVEAQITTKHFRSLPDVKRQYSPHVAEKKTRVYIDDISGCVFSTQDHTQIGRARPVDFTSEKQVDKPIAPKPGFEAFCNALLHIQRNRFVMGVTVEYGSISGQGDFAIMADGTRREYAIATIKLASGKRCSVVEVNCSDDWSLSTLIVRRVPDSQVIAQDVIKQLISAGGHWSKSYIPEAQCYPLRHGKRRPEHWAALVLSHCN